MTRQTLRRALGAIALASLVSTPAQGAPPPEAPATDSVSIRLPLGDFAEDLPTLVDPAARYTLYLPRSYDPRTRQPVLLVFDPRGRARHAAEIFRPASDRFGWILVSSHDTRSDTGSWDPNLRAFRALWPEIRRYAIDPERIYTTGFSGGAMFAWIVAQQTGEVAGVLSVGGRPIRGLDTEDPPFVHWGAAGAWDFNVGAMQRVDDLFAEEGIPHWLEIFDGPHRWIPPELATQAIGWMELQAMRRGLRPRDPALIDELWRSWWARGERWEAEGDLVRARSRYAQMASSFEGLRPIDAARHAVGRLEEESSWRRQVRERNRGNARVERYETETLPLLLRAAGSGPAGEAAGVSELRRALGVERLLREAEGEGHDAVVAKRLLHQIYTQASFYLPREWIALGNPRAARTVLELALGIHVEPRVLVELARCHARLGDEGAALGALRRAVEAGWEDVSSLHDDPDFAALRRGGQLETLSEAIPRASGDPEELNPSAGSASGSDGGRP